ncbi:MAG: hypothetical protein O2816_17145, partial [Planctomycetota bacterium]|nr:hypothetical protein [Planctomycetota bacterium]
LGVVSRADGSTRYFHPYAGKQPGIHAATPVVIGDALFVSAGTIPSSGLFALAEEEVQPVWESRDMVSSFSGSVLMGGHLYGFGGQVLECIDLEGKVQWSERGIGNGAVSGAGDRLLVMGGDGALRVAKATPAGFEVLSEVPLFEEGRYWTKPVLVNGIIYCRSSKGRVIARDHRLEEGE